MKGKNYCHSTFILLPVQLSMALLHSVKVAGGPPVVEAARLGQLSTVRKLLDGGTATVDDRDEVCVYVCVHVCMCVRVMQTV